MKMLWTAFVVQHIPHTIWHYRYLKYSIWISVHGKEFTNMLISSSYATLVYIWFIRQRSTFVGAKFGYCFSCRTFCFTVSLILLLNWHCQNIMYCPVIHLKLFAIPRGLVIGVMIWKWMTLHLCKCNFTKQSIKIVQLGSFYSTGIIQIKRDQKTKKPVFNKCFWIRKLSHNMDSIDSLLRMVHWRIGQLYLLKWVKLPHFTIWGVL